MREAYQPEIGQRILNSNYRVHLNPNFRESGLELHTYINLPSSRLNSDAVLNERIKEQTRQTTLIIFLL